MTDKIIFPIPHILGIDLAFAPDKTILCQRGPDFSLTYEIKGPKTYYSSAWTGRVSPEEKWENDVSKIISEKFSQQMEKEIANAIAYGTSHPEMYRDDKDVVGWRDIFLTTPGP